MLVRHFEGHDNTFVNLYIRPSAQIFTILNKKTW